jgi:DNA-binding transcriptional LysR family regulator
VDRQIIQLEEDLGTQLFERTPTGMRMTAAGEILIDGVRRWRRDLQRIRSEIDNIVGLRRGKVAIGIVEGATEFVSAAIADFQKQYPAIEFRMQVYGAQGVIDQVLSGDMDVGDVQSSGHAVIAPRADHDLSSWTCGGSRSSSGKPDGNLI